MWVNSETCSPRICLSRHRACRLLDGFVSGLTIDVGMQREWRSDIFISEGTVTSEESCCGAHRSSFVAMCSWKVFRKCLRNCTCVVKWSVVSLECRSLAQNTLENSDFTLCTVCLIQKSVIKHPGKSRRTVILIWKTHRNDIILYTWWCVFCDVAKRGSLLWIVNNPRLVFVFTFWKRV
jgi:hypothetical protein